MLEQLETRLQDLIAPASGAASVPGVVLVASNDSPSADVHTFQCGPVSYSLERPSAAALTTASTMWFASATKMLTSLAAIQLVERGLWDLDRPVAEAVPEIAAIRVLAGFNEDGSPKYADNDSQPGGTRITLRHLLTHTSGMAYDFSSPHLQKWWKWRGQDEGRDALAEAQGIATEMYGGPLLREPGVDWEYGPSVDWAGTLVEKVYKEEPGRLGHALQREVFDKVGVAARDVVWRRADNQWDEKETSERWADLVARRPDGLAHAGPLPPQWAKDDLGGASIRISAEDYFKVLESILKNDGRILKNESVTEYIFKPQFVDNPGKLGANLAAKQRTGWAQHPAGIMLTGGQPLPVGEDPSQDEYEYNHGLAGALSRKKGTTSWAVHWGGAPNIQWFVDPGAGVAGVFATQTLPPGDPFMCELGYDFRKAVLSDLGKSREG